MRRRFGRGRRNRTNEDSGGERIDSGRWLEKLSSEPGIDATGLSAVDPSPVPAEGALIARGQDAAGAEIALAFSPRSGADALLAGLGYMQLEGLRGTLLAVAPTWSSFARQLQSKLAPLPFTLRATELPSLLDTDTNALAVAPHTYHPMPPGHLAAHLTSDREPFLERCLMGLRGLAAKHGGALQSWGGRVEMVLQAERVASLSVSAGSLRLETLRPDRGQIPLDDASLAGALDRLEGSLRKYLNDRKVRAGEGALRGAVSRIFAQAAGATALRPWPLAGERQALDLAGVDGEGRNFVAAARERFRLTDLAEILEAAWGLQPVWPLVMDGETRLRVGPPELLLAARHFDEVALAALAGLAQNTRLFDLETARGERHGLSPRPGWVPTLRAEAPEEAAKEAPEASPPAASPPAASPPETSPPEASPPEPAPAEAGPTAPATPPQRGGDDPRTRPPRSRSRGRTQPRSDDEGIEEVSLFDLDDTGNEEGERAGRSSSRRRGRRRSRRGRSGRDEAAGEGEQRPAAPERAAREERRVAEPAGDEADDAPTMTDDDEIFALAQDAPDPDAREMRRYDEEEPADDEGAEAQAPSASFLESAVAPEPRARRKRTAFVVCAERSSILSAALMARDIRQLEGFWIYPQRDLMTFFRSVATDLREDTVICVVGFTASPPARDSIQAAALYRERIDWFDHHDWPPEDLSALREALGEEHVHVVGGLESPMPLTHSQSSRRSRFSDRLVDLGVGRFTLHDYERWGRVWWHRLGELTESRGDQRATVAPLLAGRPSDLTREAARVPTPPSPAEIDYVSGRDFRLVHFGGYTLVVLDVPQELDLHLAARAARERYDAQLSLAGVEGRELLVLAADEAPGHRGFDLAGMVEHLCVKYLWIDTLPGEDHVARLRVHGLRDEEGRLDEVVSEIAMGRSIVEA